MIEQLKVGGILVIPVGTKSQDVLMFEKLNEENKTKMTKLLAVRYVPLCDREYQCPELYAKK